MMPIGSGTVYVLGLGYIVCIIYKNLLYVRMYAGRGARTIISGEISNLGQGSLSLFLSCVTSDSLHLRWQQTGKKKIEVRPDVKAR